MNGQRRVFIQMLLQQPIRPLHTAQGLCCKPLRTGAIIRWQFVQDPPGQKFGHQPRLIPKDLIQHIDRCTSRLHACIRHHLFPQLLFSSMPAVYQ